MVVKVCAWIAWYSLCLKYLLLKYTAYYLNVRELFYNSVRGYGGYGFYNRNNRHELKNEYLIMTNWQVEVLDQGSQDKD